ncbi:hypothetical protein EBT31_09600 [bacterium]|jgi:hypothetical protein|nr:hypothetical protein [bacterium]
MHDKVMTLVDVARKRYEGDSYACGYFGSMVSGMLTEMRTRGGREMKEMADHYERVLSQSIKNIQEGK